MASRIAALQKASASLIQEIPLYSVAHRQPGESMSTCATHRSSSSCANVSAYQVEPAYRPVEWPGHQAMRTVRLRRPRCCQKTRASSIRLASPVALSPMPWCHESMWPCTSTNRSGSSVPGISATSTGQRFHPSSSLVLIVTSTGPASTWALSACPSGRLIAMTGIAGFRPIESRSGAPQIVVQMPSWIACPGFMKMSARAPSAARSATFLGVASPSVRTILPWISFRPAPPFPPAAMGESNSDSTPSAYPVET